MGDKTTWNSLALPESDINTYLSHTGGAWNTWAPTLTQLGAVTVTATRATYFRAGRFIEFHATLAVTGSGTGSNSVLMSLPVPAASSGHSINGSGYITDASASTNYPGFAYLNSTTTVGLSPAGSSSGFGLLGFLTFTAALASGDGVQISGTYQAAS